MEPERAPQNEADSSQEPAELNYRILAPAMRWLEDRKGRAALLDVALEAGLDPKAVTQGTVWVSQDQVERALRATYRWAGDDETFLEACSYELAESYGPWRFLVRAAHPATLHRLAARSFHLVSRFSRLYVEELGPTRVRLTYVTDRAESRLMCLSRQAQAAAGPSLWGLPHTPVEEHACVTRGDPACVYDVRVPQRRRVWPAIVGGVAGTAAGAVLQVVGLDVPVWLVGLLGAFAGSAIALRGMLKESVRAGEDVSDALRHVASKEAEARAEIAALHRRQRQWSLMLEEQLADRTKAVQTAVERLRRLAESRVQTLHGVSNELDSPVRLLADRLGRLAEQGASPPVIDEMAAALHTLRGVLADLMDHLEHETRGLPFAPTRIDVGALTESLDDRLRALAFGSHVGARTYRVREAPETIVCDPMLLDRILDHLLANAVRYTDEGSILVEVGGTPGYLVVKIADTGRGIDPYDLERIFGEPGGEPGQAGSAGDGRFGTPPRRGLPVVVSLLDRIGGRLEVMSRLEVGSTFWVHVPVEPRLSGTDAPADQEGARRSGVVTLISSGAE